MKSTDAIKYLAWGICFWIVFAITSANAEGCRSSNVVDIIGKPLTPELARQILKLANATNIRVLPPNEPITGEWRSDRINVQVDAAGVVVQIRCG
jgi:hypothetical protein